MKDVGELPEAAVKSEFGDRCCSVKIFGYQGFGFEMLAQYIHAHAIESEWKREKRERKKTGGE
jgi:hypothetical protein